MHEDWPEATAKVSRCIFHRGYRSAPSYYMLAFTYVVDGVTYDGGLECGDEMPEGETFPIHYDPRNPGRNNSEIAGNWTKWFTWIFTAVVLVLFVYFWLKR